MPAWIVESIDLDLEQVIPECDRTLSIFKVEEFDLMLSGHSTLDMDDWKQYTQYTGDYNESSDVVGWFWSAVEKFSPEVTLTAVITDGSSSRGN